MSSQRWHRLLREHRFCGRVSGDVPQACFLAKGHDQGAHEPKPDEAEGRAELSSISEERRWLEQIAHEIPQEYGAGSMPDMIRRMAADLRNRAANVRDLQAQLTANARTNTQEIGGWRIGKTSCHCNREDDGHGWAVLFEDRMVRCLGCLRDGMNASSEVARLRAALREIGRRAYAEGAFLAALEADRVLATNRPSEEKKA